MRIMAVVFMLVATQLHGVSDEWTGKTDHPLKTFGMQRGESWVEIPEGTDRNNQIDLTDRLAPLDSNAKRACVFAATAAFVVCLKLVPWVEERILHYKP